jgi:hypothetical protein
MVKNEKKCSLKPQKIVNYLTNKPANTCDTVAQVCGVSWCAKNQHRTHTHDTHFGSTVGKPIPARYPSSAQPQNFHFWIGFAKL